MEDHDLKSGVRYAGFWKRFVADVIDSILLNLSASLIVLMVLGCFYWVGILFEKTSPSEISLFEKFNPLLIQVLLVMTRFLSSLVYYTWGTYRYGTTVGKRCFRVYVVNYRDRSSITLQQSLVRFLGYVLSWIPFGAGYWMVAFQSEKRGLHDFVAGTVCVIRPKAVTAEQKTHVGEVPENSSQLELTLEN